MYFETIRTKDILKYIQKPNTLIVDLRDSKEYKKGHIPSSVNIPYEDLDQYLHSFCDYQVIVLYCERGNLSLLAARDLSNHGLQGVKSLYGGLKSYAGKLEKI